MWLEHREATRGRDLDITGLSYDILERQGPQQWPYPEGAESGKARLYEDGIFHTPSGRARFSADRYKPVAERVDAKYPLQLSTGRLRDQWHGMSRTGNVVSLFGNEPEPRLSLNPADMSRRGIAEGAIVRVDSRRGALHVMARGDASVRSGQAWLPMHWGKRFLGGRDSAGANTVTSPAFDPHSRQPELKHAAVKVQPVELAWRAVAFADIPAQMLSATHAALQELQPDVTFISMVPMGRDRTGLLLRAANNGAPPEAWLRRLDALLGLEADDVLSYDDPRRGHSRRIRIAGERLVAVRLAGEEGAITSGEWLRGWLLEGRPVAEIRRMLLSPARHAPSGFVLAGRVVCQCHNVSEADVIAGLAAAHGDAATRLVQVERELKCGSNCGSCKPELRTLAAKAAASSRPEVKVVAWQ